MKATVPAFTGDRWRVLAPLVTPRVVELARERIRTGRNLFSGAKLRVSDERAAVKIALLLAHELNPLEAFSAEEEALMRGIDADTLRKRRRDGLAQPL